MSEKKLSSNFIQNISYKKEIDDLNRKKGLAEELISNKINIKDLTDNEVDEMTEYFKSYINEMNHKLEKIKENIMNLRNKDCP